MKFKTEVEMCEHVTMIISGLLIPIYHKYIPEVPRSPYNNHADMLFLLQNGRMFIVEYKLNNPMELLRQINNHSQHGSIGIVNQKLSDDFKEKNRYKPIFQFTGQDWEIEKLARYIFNKRGEITIGTDYRKVTSRYDTAPIYFWGYKNTGSSLTGGIKHGKRLSFYELYMQAVRNLQEKYNNKLDFCLVHSVLGFYSLNVAKKHFKNAMNNLL